MMQKAISDPNRRTPPNRVGARAFRWARLTSLALIVLVPYALLVLLRVAGRDFAFVQHSLSRPWIALPLLALVAVGVWHMWLGMREILEDYARGTTLGTLLLANTLFCLAIVLAAGGGVLKLWLGA